MSPSAASQDMVGALRWQILIDAISSVDRLERIRTEQYPAVRQAIEEAAKALPWWAWDENPGLAEAVETFRVTDVKFEDRLQTRMARIGGKLAQRVLV